MDFRVGGRERRRAVGRRRHTTFDAVYHDIVPNERIVYTYEMHLDDRKISVSLATLQIKPAGAGRTKLSVTEQGAFLDGYDDAARANGARACCWTGWAIRCGAERANPDASLPRASRVSSLPQRPSGRPRCSD